MGLQIRPISFHVASEYVKKYHRHHGATSGGKFSIACYDGDRLCGVAICCRPVARALDDGLTVEVARVCTNGTRNACSKLYGACARIARDMGYEQIITYTLDSECGASLRASGWNLDGKIKGHSWSTPSRQRVDKAPTCDKFRWKKRLGQ